MKGNHPSLTEKIRITSSPEKNVGIENPKKAIDVAIWSKIEYCLTAARMPIGRAISRLTRNARPITNSVVGSRPRM